MERIGKIISWEKEGREAGVGWIRHRVSKYEIHEYMFDSSTKQTSYQPVTGDRCSFVVKKKLGLARACDIKFLRTGN